MRSQSHPDAESVSPSLLQQMADVCDGFADAWKAGQRPAIEDYLGSTPEPTFSLLLLELLVVEFQYRCQNNESLVAEKFAEGYVSRFPDHAGLIRAAFGGELSAERASLSDHLAHTKP